MVSDRADRGGSCFDPHRYWHDRHGCMQTDLRAVGNIALSSEQNAVQLHDKFGILSVQIGDWGRQPPDTLLDIGCGRAFLTVRFAESGFDCTGVDTSAEAITGAPAHPRLRVLVGRSETLDLPERFDLILCWDVLYHVVDDDAWLATLRNIHRHLAEEGDVSIVEFFHTARRRPPHCTWRSLERYQAALSDVGLKLDSNESFVESVTGDRKAHLRLRKSQAVTSIASAK